jgi:hypothetical protein
LRAAFFQGYGVGPKKSTRGQLAFFPKNFFIIFFIIFCYVKIIYGHFGKSICGRR